MEKSIKKYRIDLHCHSRFSHDGVADPQEMIQVAKAKGLDGFVITDHNTCSCVDYFEEKGYLRRDGKAVDGFLIIPGQEISTEEGHLLAIGITLPPMKDIQLKEAIAIIQKKGGIAIPAHPFDYFRLGIKEKHLDLHDFDALEVFNAAITFKHCNQKAKLYALKRKLPMTAGSDAHHAQMIGIAYSILEMEDLTVQKVLEAIKNHPSRQERYLSFTESLKKNWNILRSKIKFL